MDDGRAEVRWAPRISKDSVRRLYESEARGMLDGELLDDVGVALLLRCQSILDVHEAKRGRVRCPRCDRAGRRTIIERTPGRGHTDVMACPACGWSILWREYLRTFKRRQLNSGGAVKAFETYVSDCPRARTPREKMLLVDRLIHEFHCSSRDEPGRATRAVGANLIKGKLDDVIEFLDRLSAGPGDRKRTRDDWRERLGETHWAEGRNEGGGDR